jgi:carbamoyl-phosphate synthase large subunit
LKPIRVMVTGAGSGVGQGIIKALNICKYDVTIYSADISTFNSALYRTDKSLLIPKVEEPKSLDLILDIITSNRIDVVMIGSEFDLNFFSANSKYIYSQTGAITIVSPIDTVKIADDKWLTAKFLTENNLPNAKSFISEDINEVCHKASEWGFPIMVKARSGTSSRDVYIVNNMNELTDKWSSILFPMLQQVIDIPSQELNNEYTCSIFKTLEGSIIGPFCARRSLKGGTSWHVEVKPFKKLTRILLEIGNKLDFNGSLNVQLMMGADGPIPFEINARFSGTTAIRAHFGFNEPELALQSFYYKEEPIQPDIKSGMAFRYHEEVFVDNVSISSLGKNSQKGVVRRWF